ncbi:hypothetical protein [Patiriisocius hiemis]|uniref:Uncharacterized protein n=1 Tax=Patiriisocius hiemis TaxID=3075604 RepID=A0ABU2YDY4_9FLAO|nr:hypothetical protein [Constantimarinum sp. W242]MDT0556402.1 hypothetical protein [Constantimarinum sp. W242]
MNSIIKIITFVCVALLLQSCIVITGSPEDCEVVEITVNKIYEGGEKDIVFAEDNGDFYYINRGLEQGYTLEGLRGYVLNKKATLHLANTLVGGSNHIAQIKVSDSIIFTEFTKQSTE